MARRKTSRLRWLRIVVLLFLIYAGVFLVWSRVRTFEVRGENRRMWSFCGMPGGLAALNPQRWNEWKQREKIAAIIFYPCVLLDERWTERWYWPRHFADPPQL
ncbi:MAG TPA: hypothetical protein VK530_13525 [Candidatus Acidoferrum sp.]|nr:hypothetical protein [Candidatus Acidoferrum sp.]